MRPRLHHWGVKIGRFTEGRENAITDVAGVKVGHSTLIRGQGKLVPGVGPVRTGVTAIFPHSKGLFHARVATGIFALNGAGDIAGLPQVEEWGVVETPILLTNTLSVGQVHDAVLDYLLERYPEAGITADPMIPLVAECDDSHLNDIRGRHATKSYTYDALDNATDGPVAEGCVGAGTGMISFEFKSGIGTASRVLPTSSGGFTVGVLVLSNFGKRSCLRIAGLPVGRILTDRMPVPPPEGSIVAVLATNAPLHSWQLRRVAKRMALGIGRTGSYASHISGEFCIAFSNSTLISRKSESLIYSMEVLHDSYLDPIYEAAVDATEEAIVNSLLQATDMKGRDNHVVYAIEVEKLYALLKSQGIAQ